MHHVLSFNNLVLQAASNLWYCVKVVFRSSLVTSSCSTSFSSVTLGMRWTIWSCIPLLVEYNCYWQKQESPTTTWQSISISILVYEDFGKIMIISRSNMLKPKLFIVLDDYMYVAQCIYVLWPSGALYVTAECTQGLSGSLFLTSP